MLFLVGLELESKKVWELCKILFGLGDLQVVGTMTLITTGESASAAAKIINHFERHDLEQLEASRKIRHDKDTISNLAQKGREDLKALLELEQIKLKQENE